MLNQKPNTQFKKKDWKVLNQQLQDLFSSDNLLNPSFIMDMKEYTMTSDEVIVEAEKKGYKVTSNEDGTILKIE